MVNERLNTQNPGETGNPLGTMPVVASQHGADTQKTLNYEGAEVFDSSDEDVVNTRDQRERRRARFGSPNRDRHQSRNERSKSRHRHFTFEHDGVDLKLVEHVLDEGATCYEDREHARFTNEEQLISAATKGNLDGIFEAAVASLNELGLAEQQVEELQNTLVQTDNRNDELSSSLKAREAEVKELKEALGIQARDLERVRNAKSAYRAEKKEAQRKIEELEKLVEKHIPLEEEGLFDSSDEEARERSTRSQRRTGTPASSRPEISNSKWPDIKEYFGDNEKQREEYPQWRL
ncbi:hypothetical protein K402DRAFT_458616, partial [Aulographum hederae CBS 113979]